MEIWFIWLNNTGILSSCCHVNTVRLQHMISNETFKEKRSNLHNKALLNPWRISPERSSCSATYVQSHNPSKWEEEDMLKTVGEVRTYWTVTFSYGLQHRTSILAELQRLTFRPTPFIAIRFGRPCRSVQRSDGVCPSSGGGWSRLSDMDSGKLVFMSGAPRSASLNPRGRPSRLLPSLESLGLLDGTWGACFLGGNADVARDIFETAGRVWVASLHLDPPKKGLYYTPPVSGTYDKYRHWTQSSISTKRDRQWREKEREKRRGK